MNVKATNLIRHLEKNGRIILKMDRASGVIQIVIRKLVNDYAVGTHPDGTIRRANFADVRAMLIANSVYVLGYK